MNTESSGRSRVRFLSALRFGGATSDRVRQTAGNGDSDFGTGTPGTNFSIVCLICPTTLTSLRQIWARDANGNGHSLALSGTAGAVLFTASRAVTATSDTYLTTTALKLNKWSWLAFTRDTAATNICKGYVGSLNTAFSADAGTPTNGTGVLDSDAGLLTTIGNGINIASPTVAFQGMIAFFARYHRALSLNELCQIQFGLLDGNLPKLPNCIELLNIGDRGMGRKCLNYGINQSFDFTVTGAKSAQTNIPIPFLAANLRRTKYKAPAAGTTVLPKRTLMGVGI